MTRGPIPDDVPINLQEQILLEDARSQPGIEIQGGRKKPLGDVPRLVANYGGSSEDWYKISSNQSAIIDGAIVEIHWRSKQSYWAKCRVQNQTYISQNCT